MRCSLLQGGEGRVCRSEDQFAHYKGAQHIVGGVVSVAPPQLGLSWCQNPSSQEVALCPRGTITVPSGTCGLM